MLEKIMVRTVIRVGESNCHIDINPF